MTLRIDVYLEATMLERKIMALVAGLIVCAPALPAPVHAQVNRVKRAARQEAESRAAQMVEDAIRCAVDDRDCVAEARGRGEPVVLVDGEGNIITDENGNPVTDPDEAANRTQKPGEGVWRNYDFTPGGTVWFASDFADEPVGRFPASQLQFVRGNAQVVDLNGMRVLEVSDDAEFRIGLPEELPEDFTLEFYLKTGAPNLRTMVFTIPRETAWNRYESHYLDLYQRPGIAFKGQPVSQISGVGSLSEEFTPIKLQVDGDYAILYVGTRRAANMPGAKFLRSDAIHFQVSANERRPGYLHGFVVAVGVEDMYDALVETGEFTTHGIYFDVDSDALRPESTPVLEDLRRTLEAHADLRIVIEGHTDSTGDDAHNRELSERRAASVVRYLVDNGIASDRLGAVGKGESEPAADNDTAAGRQQNRRVVIRVAG